MAGHWPLCVQVIHSVLRALAGGLLMPGNPTHPANTLVHNTIKPHQHKPAILPLQWDTKMNIWVWETRPTGSRGKRYIFGDHSNV